MESFLDAHLEYTIETESPRIAHRWCAISAIGALLGRSFYFQHGHFRVYPNLFVMLVGEPGARKSTAVKLMKKLVVGSGYDTISADKTSKEKFLLDLEGLTDEEQMVATLGGTKKYDSSTALNLWGDKADAQEPKEVFVMADEFNEFSGTNNLEFYTTLGNLWDWDDETKPFSQRLKNSRSVAIWQPTVSILGGNTHDNFNRAFPPEAGGIGFLSRMLLIYVEDTGKRITFPPEPNPEHTEVLTKFLRNIRGRYSGAAKRTDEASEILDKIYKGWIPLSDPRLRSYSTRRFTQLLKLCLSICASRLSDTITTEIVIEANTYLASAEHGMPRALGLFGAGKHSALAHKIVAFITDSSKAIGIKDLWKEVHKDLDKPADLAQIMTMLEQADLIFHVVGKGWLPKPPKMRKMEYINLDFLTEQERTFIGAGA